MYVCAYYVCGFFCESFFPNPLPHDVLGLIIPILQMRKPEAISMVERGSGIEPSILTPKLWLLAITAHL